jgi:hypothetical protein
MRVAATEQYVIRDSLQPTLPHSAHRNLSPCQGYSVQHSSKSCDKAQPDVCTDSLDDEPDVSATANCHRPTANPEAVQPHILDGLNIMRHRNVTDVYVDGNIVEDDSLKWQQLKAAGLYYKSKGREVLIFLPRLVGNHRAEFQELVRDLGKDCVVTTPSGCSDDKFMISYAQDNANSCIVTNDIFRDHELRQSWVKDHTIKFAFAAGRFVPESVHK